MATLSTLKLSAHDTGIRGQIEISKHIKQWCFTSDSGKLAPSVRYGSKWLELANGKHAKPSAKITCHCHGDVRHKFDG